MMPLTLHAAGHTHLCTLTGQWLAIPGSVGVSGEVCGNALRREAASLLCHTDQTRQDGPGPSRKAISDTIASLSQPVTLCTKGTDHL